nr:dockerin type I domain-containing protein [Myxococcota bacterium]
MNRSRSLSSLRLLIGLAALLVVACVPQSRSRDVDGNGWVEAADVLAVESCLGLEADTSQLCRAADIDRSGTVGANDVAAVEAELGTLLFNPSSIVADVDRVASSDQVLYGFSLSDDWLLKRWDLEHARWIAPIELPSHASDVAFWDDVGRALVSTNSGTVFEIDPQLGTLSPFVVETGAVEAILPVGSLVVAAVREHGQPPKLRVRDASAVALSDRVVDEPPVLLSWSEAEGRIYWLGPDDVHWAALDRATGQLGATGSYPRNSSSFYYPLAVRPSPDGAVHSVSGRFLYRSADAAQIDQLNFWAWDQAWTDTGQLVSLVHSTDPWGTVLVLSDPVDFETVDEAFFPGEPIRIHRDALGITVVTRTEWAPGVFAQSRYAPGNDGDGDGIPYGLDELPLDGAASVDTDHDGAPDAWNPGSGPEQSATGLTLDAFPLDTACQQPEDALASDPTRCDYAKEVPNVVDPDARFVDSRGILHLLDRERGRIFRWSPDLQSYVDSIRVRRDTHDMTYSAALDRIYTHTTTEIQSLDAGADHPEQIELLWTADRMGGTLAPGDPFEAVGSYLYFFEEATGGAVLGPDGTLLDTGQPVIGSTPPFDPTHLRVFQGSAWIAIDPATGTFTGYPRTPTYGPIHGLGASAFLDHEGQIHSVPGFGYLGAISSPADGLTWLPDGTLATLEKDHALRTTRFERWDASGRRLDLAELPGVADDVVVVDSSRVVVASVTTGTELLVVPIGTDGDGDGVAYDFDAFPLDPAASTDTDRDGWPDVWNPGRTAADSTLGLTIDAFPTDAGCQLASQGLPGDPGTCDIEAATPSYLPDEIHAGPDGTVFLLDRARSVLRRWSPALGTSLEPIPLGEPTEHFSVGDSGAVYL